jgi:glycosyltransferase involved in cell wall biosynthesis
VNKIAIDEIKFSCIITVCDREEFISQAIESILSQSIDAFEIIIIDNGYNSVAIRSDLFERVKVYKVIPYIGVAQALNFGVSLSSGNVVAFLEDDDYWNSKYLENIKKEFCNGKDFVISRIDKLIDGKIEPYKDAVNKVDISTLLVTNPGVTISNLSVLKKSIFEINGFDTKLATSADKALIIDLLSSGHYCSVLSSNQVIGRFHSGDRLGKNSKKLTSSLAYFIIKYWKIMTFKQIILSLYKVIVYKFYY